MAEHDRTVPYHQEVGGLLIPGGFSREAFQDSLNYVPRDGDLFICTYPKCGTTWTQQIVYLIYNRGVPGDSMLEVFRRSPFLELFGRESVEEMLRPGAIKVHLPFHLTPYSVKAKYLCVLRNPKDVCVSFFHHMITDSLFTFQEGTFDSFFEYFVSGKVAYNDYFDHVLGWYEQRNRSNVCIITYEELKNDTRNTVLKIAKFMGDEWFEMLQNDEETLTNVLKYSRFDFMKDQFDYGQMKDTEGSFKVQDITYPGWRHAIEFSATHCRESDKKFRYLRSGKVGSWRDVLSKDQLARLNAKIEQKLKDTDFYQYWKSIGCI